ncbi:MAG: hypothetical protein R6X19_07045 [Kiritimatiellia bacterium]
MRWLNVSYGMWHNRRWKESGPVVQGRYHAVPVDGEGAGRWKRAGIFT